MTKEYLKIFIIKNNFFKKYVKKNKENSFVHFQIFKFILKKTGSI